jgi:sigma-54 dependent transcriptional regulator, acetoin dehydrogenase operon transcriptional activator AcoR
LETKVMTASLSNPFFATRSQQVDFARRRFFDDGIAPAGVVSDAVFQSWARSQRLHRRPEHAVEFEPVSQSRTHHVLQRNQPLLQAWCAEVPQLQMLLGTSSCAAMLTDSTGVLIGATCAGRPHESLMPVATRLGVNLSEEAVGTTAPGIVVRTGQAVCVLGAEHFFDQVQQMHCAAAPIFDTQGALAGVLDISSEAIEFGFDAATVVGHLACTIENRLLIAQSAEHLILKIQVAPALLQSSMVGLVGIQPDGRVAWLNSVACSLLGVASLQRSGERPLAEAVLGSGFGHLASLPLSSATLLSLPSGLALWACLEQRERTPARGSVQAQSALPVANQEIALTVSPMSSMSSTVPTAPAVEPEAVLPTVKTIHQDLLQKTLQECGGNLTQAALRLGVSRGWICRRLRATSR